MFVWLSSYGLTFAPSIQRHEQRDGTLYVLHFGSVDAPSLGLTGADLVQLRDALEEYLREHDDVQPKRAKVAP